MLVFVSKRLLHLIPVLIGVIFLTFFLSHLAVHNPCAVWLGPKADRTAISHCIQYFGLDQPVTSQFQKYLSSLVTGDWGSDPVSGTPVLMTIQVAFPATLELVLASLFLMIIIGIPLGVMAAVHQGKWVDHLVRIFYLSGWSTPTYLGGVLLAILVAPGLGLPSGGEFTTDPTFTRWTHMSIIDALLAGNLPATSDAIAHLFLPAVALAFINMGIATRMTRSSMLEVLPQDFVKTARMKGLPDFWVVYKHALRNSLITTTTVLGIAAGGLLSGTVVIEEIFRWPGIGDFAYLSILGGNFPGTVAVVIVFAIGVVLSNLAADIIYGLLDPRVDWR